MVRRARLFASDLLGGWQVAESDRDAAILIIGELGANAARHGGTEMSVRLSLRGTALRIEVSDAGTIPRQRTTSAPDGAERLRTLVPADAEHGRGLDIVRALAVRVETETVGRRHTVWADLVVTVALAR